MMLSKFREPYLQELRKWNKIHRLVGSKDLDRLYSESATSFKSLPKGERYRRVLDVGAGSGIQGFAGLFSGALEQVAFVEPDPKKSSFIIHVKTLLAKEESDILNRVLILSMPIQLVSRETLEKFFGAKDWIVVARAFSGDLSLKESLSLSELKEKEVFSFRLSPENKTMLERI